MRTIVESERSVLDDVPRSVIFAAPLLERFQTLRLCAGLASLAPRIEELPRCRTLELILDWKQPLFQGSDITAPLRLPELCTVIVGTGEERPTIFLTVDAASLYKFLSQLLGALPKRPSLRLHGVSVSGDRDELLRAFDVSS